MAGRVGGDPSRLILFHAKKPLAFTRDALTLSPGHDFFQRAKLSVLIGHPASAQKHPEPRERLPVKLFWVGGDVRGGSSQLDPKTLILLAERKPGCVLLCVLVVQPTDCSPG